MRRPGSEERGVSERASKTMSSWAPRAELELNLSQHIILALSSAWWMPDPQRRMTRSVMEISISGEHFQVVMETQANEEGIDGPELHASAPARISDVGSRNVIVSTGDDRRERREVLHDRVAGLRSPEALEQLLKHEPCGIDGLLRCQSLAQTAKLGTASRRVSP